LVRIPSKGVGIARGWKPWSERVIRGKVFLELEDVRAALATSPEVRTFRIVLIVVSLAAVAFVRRTAVEFGASPSAVAGVSAVAGAFCAVTLLLARWRAPRRMLERMTREECELRFEFSESGYVITRGASRAESAWPGVRRIVEGPESFQLSLQLKGGQIVPKRAFADSDVSRLRELFARHAKSQ
jgi:hypothetical protein